MISKKLKIVCSVTVSRLEFVPVPITDQLQLNFKNCHVWNGGLQNYTEKVPCTVLLNVPNFCLHCVYRVYSRPLLSATTALNLVSGDLKKIFSSEMDKNDIYLGSVSKQNASFLENLP